MQRVREARKKIESDTNFLIYGKTREGKIILHQPSRSSTRVAICSGEQAGVEKLAIRMRTDLKIRKMKLQNKYMGLGIP